MQFLDDIFTYIKQLSSQSNPEGDKNTSFTQMVKYIDNHFHLELYLKDLSVKFLINQVYCCQLLKEFGQNLFRICNGIADKKACELLKQTELSIEEITTKVGYSDYYYFNKVFKKHCGITPTKFRKS